MKIEKGRRVKLKVDLSVAGGQQLEKNTVEYVQGAGTMLPGLEKVLEGLEPGAKRDGVLKPKEAFAAMSPSKTMKRSEFPKDAKLTKGDKLVAAGADKAHMITFMCALSAPAAMSLSPSVSLASLGKSLRFIFLSGCIAGCRTRPWP